MKEDKGSKRQWAKRVVTPIIITNEIACLPCGSPRNEVRVLPFVLVGDGEVSVSKRATSRENNFSDERCTTKAKCEVQMMIDCAKRSTSPPTSGSFVQPFGPQQHCCPALRYHWIRQSCTVAQKIRFLSYLTRFHA